ncbi:exopolysaccharide biosynthesis polyprenyl glycosylphosphotransferase [Sulfobacillus acidophilus TPY]|uniref:Exopolysaccharide biosynthesis polyprenyl glycosylphosphotransferase n=1 Tax=Sulfobacillus acidophilus (strain ATCC 700253 / DSM 10332 / NAL) TaxID=679936 RepID=G8TT60_SULAD|nr:exopolysaccharide biosynthesis polyprenyl glycosylphosphotransferase [Sulfobacillus acidophilus TPY]AEW06760.1 exopolysaccharide biosynthesis polyprenyl glycosylphosphotransferase [Sulfobacillus acidophilus DSM 10332]
MFRGRTNRWDELAVFVDTGAAYIAYLLVVHAYLTWLNPRVATVQLLSHYFSFSVAVLATSWMALKLNFRGYSRRWNQLPAEMVMLFISNVESAIGLALLIFVLKATWFSRAIFVLFPVAAMLLQTGVHATIKLSLGHFRLSGRDQRRLIVLGYPKRARIFADTVAHVPEAGMHVVDLIPIELGHPDESAAGVSRVHQLILSTVVDTVVIALPVADEVLMPVIDMARRQGKEVRLILDEMGVLAHRSRLYDFYGNSVLVVDASWAHQTSRSLVKRGIDIVLSGLAILVTAPIMAIIALAIKLDDPHSPVLFVQRRVGLNGRTFPLLKFRTMVPNAEELKAQLSHLNVMSGPVFKIPDDPRVTPIGRFLRRTSLDELPQLFNVFVGQMSLVGPRPALPSEVKLYGEDYRKRLSVRPGITCLWQISGRNEIDFQDWMRLDMEYIEHWSLALDLKILAKTIPAVLQQRGAH